MPLPNENGADRGEAADSSDQADGEINTDSIGDQLARRRAAAAKPPPIAGRRDPWTLSKSDGDDAA